MTPPQPAGTGEQGRSFAHFDNMTWPLPNGELEWRLRYAPNIPLRDRLVAASILSAYAQMVGDPTTKRQKVVRALRAALLAVGAPGETVD